MDDGTCEFIDAMTVACRLNITRSQVYRLLRRRKLPAIRLGKYWRIPWPACLDAFQTGFPFPLGSDEQADDTPQTMSDKDY